LSSKILEFLVYLTNFAARDCHPVRIKRNSEKAELRCSAEEWTIGPLKRRPAALGANRFLKLGLRGCQCRDKTPAILPVLLIRAAVSLGGDAVGTLQ
jgi:hypothetical protein